MSLRTRLHLKKTALTYDNLRDSFARPRRVLPARLLDSISLRCTFLIFRFMKRAGTGSSRQGKRTQLSFGIYVNVSYLIRSTSQVPEPTLAAFPEFRSASLPLLSRCAVMNLG